ncbi:hypothetical protein [Roseivirga sp.]|uniref:hypothetical protein n=1 Tax=Roseivirga sp. TaxID=1964215 RepID=UPI003B519247
MNTTTLYRPVNQAELDLIKASGWNAFPPRLPEQPIFYPVMNFQYAEDISKKWNVDAYGIGYIVKWEMDSAYLSRFNVENVGGSHHNELWVPAEELEEFNSKIIGKIELIAEYK